MRKRLWLTVLLVLLLLAIGATAVQAQATNGAIRGTLYQDTDVDGICGAGDPTISGVPIDFAPDGGQTITLTSGADGTYGLASVTLGTWRVAARPLEGWVTTSLTPIVVVLSTGQPVSENVNFCLAQGTTGSPTPTPPPATTLPESGATVPPSLLAAAVLGAVLLFAGMGLIVRDRRAAG